MFDYVLILVDEFLKILPYLSVVFITMSIAGYLVFSDK